MCVILGSIGVPYNETAAMLVLQVIPFEFELFLRATRGARNPNLQVVITHASLVACMYPAFVWTSSKNVLNTQNVV